MCWSGAILDGIQVEYVADSLKLDILELARTGNKLVSVSGRPEWMCQAVEVADPITFTTPDTVLVNINTAFSQLIHLSGVEGEGRGVEGRWDAVYQSID